MPHDTLRGPRPRERRYIIYSAFGAWPPSRNNAPNVPKLRVFGRCRGPVQSENDLTADKYVGRSARHWIMLIAEQRVTLFDDAGCAHAQSDPGSCPSAIISIFITKSPSIQSRIIVRRTASPELEKSNLTSEYIEYRA